MARRKAAPPVPTPAGGYESGEDPADRVLDNPERGPSSPNAAGPARASVSVDTLITRTDLGPGVHTLVIAGQLIPIGLENFPRQPA
jgi:hypothetical protein